jgi:hypothetical protein
MFGGAIFGVGFFGGGDAGVLEVEAPAVISVVGGVRNLTPIIMAKMLTPAITVMNLTPSITVKNLTPAITVTVLSD